MEEFQSNRCAKGETSENTITYIIRPKKISVIC